MARSGRTAGPRPSGHRPAHALSEAERARIVELANEPRFASTPPARIVPALADEGVYVASEASFHRVLRDHGQMRRRGRARPPRTVRPAQHACGDRPGPGLVLGCDLPAGPRAGALVLPVPHPRPLQPQDRRSTRCTTPTRPSTPPIWSGARRWPRASTPSALRPVLHGDNGPSVKGTTVLAMLYWLGIAPSHSRPAGER